MSSQPTSTQSLSRRIIGVVCLFLLLGHVMLFSATGVLGLQKHGSEFYFLIRQASCAVVGALLMLGLSRIRYQALRKFALPLMVLQIGLVSLTLFSSLKHHALGASRWIHFAGLSFQPSELAKISLTIYLAHLLSVNEKSRLSPKQWSIHGATVLLLLGLILKQPDLGSTILLSCIVLALLFLAGLRPIYFIGFIGVGIIGLAFAMLNSEYRRRRLIAFLNPWAEPQGSGFQTIQSMLSIHSGNVFGVGMGNGNSKLFFLPEVHTDFIFALIGEELGFVGATLCLVLFSYFGYLLFKTSAKVPDSFGRYLAFGLSVSLMIQVSVNLGGVTGILPVKGLPLPFISWGRSALLANLAMVGLILSCTRQSIPAPQDSQIVFSKK